MVKTSSKEETLASTVRYYATRISKILLKTVLGLIVASIVTIVLFRFLPVPFTPLMGIRAVQSVWQGREVKFEKDWVPIDQMSKRLQYAVIAAEDSKFFEHRGFDWEAIALAMKHNERSGRIRGASTISQQVAKNVFLFPNRSWIRKFVEAYFTALIELFWSKSRILEVYLNVVELGDGVYGVEAASKKYFKKPAARLSSSQAALIAAVLPNPHRFRIQRPSGYVRFRQTMIQSRMRSIGKIVDTKAKTTPQL